MNKHKNFIKECYEGKHGTMCQDWKDKILERYPEFERQEFKSGEWVYNNVLKTIGKLDIDGFNTSYYANKRPSSFNKLTTKEIEEHLIKDAERRGYKTGVMFYAARGSNPLCDFNSSDCYKYDSKEDALSIKSLGCGTVYHQGQWAEIIPTTTKEEAEKKLNVKIID